MQGTLVAGEKTHEESLDLPVTDAYQSEIEAPKVFDNWKVWISLAGILILAAYIPVVRQVLEVSPFGSPGYDPSIPVPLPR